MYALVNDGKVVEYPLSEGDIKHRFANTSFESPFKPPSGFVLVADSPRPILDYATEAKEGEPCFIDGQLTRTWEIYQLPKEEVQKRLRQKTEEVRADRNRKLMATDWTQLVDAPVDKEKWAKYRQELRNLSRQEGFPWDVKWPVMP